MGAVCGQKPEVEITPEMKLVGAELLHQWERDEIEYTSYGNFAGLLFQKMLDTYSQYRQNPSPKIQP